MKDSTKRNRYSGKRSRKLSLVRAREARHRRRTLTTEITTPSHSSSTSAMDEKPLRESASKRKLALYSGHRKAEELARIMSRPIILCTGNKNKLKEFLQIVGTEFPHKIEIQDVDLPEYQGEPEEVAKAKCAMAAQIVKGPVIVEDTSLCYNALGGMPGPYIKWFLKKMGTTGLHRLLHGFDNKTAYAQCVFAYSSGEGAPIHCFSGKCDGSIVEPRGSTDFGWDPVFQPDGYKQTFAELDKDVKNKISHRYKATVALKEFLQKDLKG